MKNEIEIYKKVAPPRKTNGYCKFSNKNALPGSEDIRSNQRIDMGPFIFFWITERGGGYFGKILFVSLSQEFIMPGIYF